MKVTAETITDEQIRKLRAQTGWVGARCERAQADFETALHSFDEIARRQARARCAAAWNARFGADS